jgi:hypothetical protein
MDLLWHDHFLANRGEEVAVHHGSWPERLRSSVEGGIRRVNRRRILSWSDPKGISAAAKCFCVKTGVIGLEWNYKLTACFARYVRIVSEVACRRLLDTDGAA